MRSSSVAAAVAAAVIASIAIAGLPATASAEDWKCYTYQSAPASPVNLGLRKMGEALHAITKGRVTVKCSVGGALPIDANSIAPALSDGVLDFGSVANISGYVPIAAMGLLPGLFKDNAEYDSQGWPIIKPIVSAEFEKRAIKILGLYHYPPQVVFGAKGAPPLRTLADLKGRTFRTGNPEQALFAKAIGAIPVTLPTPDVAPALQRGTVQYAVTAAASGGRLWRDFFASGILDPVFVATGYIVVNKKRWDSLSRDEQEAFQRSVDETGAWITKTQEDDDGVAVKQFIEKDKWTITPKSATGHAEIVKVMEPIWQKWAEDRGPDALKLLGDVRKALGHKL